MNYQRKSFVVATPGTADYADRWEKTFRGESTGTSMQVDLPVKVIIPTKEESVGPGWSIPDVEDDHGRCANCGSWMTTEADGQVFCSKRCFLAHT